jgi:hypothetical protein
VSDYQLYRVNDYDKVIDRINITAEDDNAAIAEAIRIDHGAHIEIWSGQLMVSRVAAKGMARPSI